ncbi:MAG: type II toxin-antitoxin system YafQ family toxin [Isosphaeraceae bacterium]
MSPTSKPLRFFASPLKARTWCDLRAWRQCSPTWKSEVAKKPRPESPTPKPAPKPLTPIYTSKFRSDVKRLEAGGKDMAKLRSIIETLAHRRPLEPRHKDHPLSGKWSRFRDCHVEPDWVLIYRRESGELILERTGSHSELFK